MSSFLKDLFSVGLSKVGVVVFSLGQNILIARWLGPELNGQLAALIVFPTLFMAVGSLGVMQSTAYYVAKGTFSEEHIKRAVIQIWILSSVFSFISCFFLIRFFSNSGSNLTLVFLAIAPVPFALFNTYSSGVFLGKNQIQSFNKVNWLPPFFIFMGTIFFMVILDLSIKGAMIALAVGPAVMSIIMLLKNRFIDVLSFRIETRVIQSLLSLGLIYAIALLIINLNYQLDVIIIDKLSTSYETGIYSKGSTLIQYLWQIPMLLSTIVFARSAIAKDKRVFSLKVCQLLRISVITILIASMFLAIFSKWVIRLLYGVQFVASSTVLVYLIPGVLLLTVFKVLNMDMAGRGKPWVSLKAMVPALMINIFLNIIWIPDYGANGAAVASTISYSIASFLFLWVYSKESGISIKDILTYQKSDFNFVQEVSIKIKAIKFF